MRHVLFTLWIGALLGSGWRLTAQIDPIARNLLELGIDQSLTGTGPQSVYGYYYHNNPEFMATNLTLRLVVAPAYVDGELGFREVLPRTDLGIGINGGGFGENQFEVREGRYIKSESFFGHGGGTSLNVYHRVNPTQLIPVHLVMQGGPRYSTYSDMNRTGDNFQLPEDRFSAFARAGVRVAGVEPMLYTDLAMEVSLWVERQWRMDGGSYGFDGDRWVEPVTDRYWLFAGLNYAFTNSGTQFTSSMMVGGSENADRFNAWRLGGVLPLASEFPMALPGYYYQEISARRFVYLSAAYVVPLSADHRWQLRLGVASAYADYLPGIERPAHWNTGAGPGLSYTSRSQVWRLILRYGYGFNAQRDGDQGAHSVGVLYQYDFERRAHRNSKSP